MAVVGGGLTGLSTAYWLAKRGRRVRVLEAAATAARASGRNAGFLLTGSAESYLALSASVGEERALAFWERSRENRRRLRSELLDRAGEDVTFLAEGSYLAAVDRGTQVEELRASGEALNRAGFRLEWLAAGSAQEASGCPHLGGALVQPRDGGLDPVKLAGALQREGAFPVTCGARVTALVPDPAGVRLETEAGELRAERAVVAVNAYAGALIPQLEAQLHPVRGQMMALAPTASSERSLRGVWYLDDGYQYARQLADGTFLLGGCRNQALEEEVGFDERPTAKIQQALDAYLEGFFPDFAGRRVVRRWAGTMALTDDGLPLVGEVPGVPQALYAAGLNGHGLSLAFALGLHLDRCLAGEAEPADFC